MPDRMGEPLRAGERALFLDARGRRFLVRLEDGGTFHFHGGAVPHDLVIGSQEGTTVHTTTGAPLVCFRPRLADFVLKMGRGAQVIYPKDVGPILVYADIGPGVRVLEAGTGSGGLTLALCRAVGPEGRVISYEEREEFQEVARANAEGFFGKVPSWLELRRGDVREVAGSGESYHRVLLDLPEPWDVLPEVGSVLVPGGIVCGYLPTTGQVQELVLALTEAGYVEVQTLEVMLRTWHVAARSVRPDHRMVGHTGFITVARRAGSGG
jgi:tRNA (adenine57-N1/adenine58-N1)-methyltransferase catalytic subunit